MFFFLKLSAIARQLARFSQGLWLTSLTLLALAVPAYAADEDGDSDSSPRSSSTILTTLRLHSAVGGEALPFTVGQGFRQGDVPSGAGIVADIADFQAIIKNRWPDGSAKFAIISGRADVSASRNIRLRAGTPASGRQALTTKDLQATGITASIEFGSYGSARWSAANWTTPAATVVSGPEMSAWTYRKPIGSDEHLVAWLEVRSYKGGRVEVLPWIENGYLRVPDPKEKIGEAKFTLGGTERFSQSLMLLNHQRAVLASGTTLTHWIGGDPKVIPQHDTAYLMATKLVPNYRPTTDLKSRLFERLPASYTPLAQAGYPSAMGTAGYHPSIGLLPEWDVAYLSTNADPRTWHGVIINGYAAGRFGIHYRDETTQLPISFASYPTLVMGSGSGVSSRGVSSTQTHTPKASGPVPPNFATSHHMSIGFMAYLVSGWHYFAEESQFVATANFLKQIDTTRKGSQGVLETSAGANNTRGAAWALRTLAQAATVTPDDDPLRAQFVNSLDANINHYYAKYIAQPSNPLGMVQPYSNYKPGSPLASATWMEDFLTAAFGYMKDLQSHSMAVRKKLDTFVQWKYRSIVGRLGGKDSDRAIAYPYAAQYTILFAPVEKPDWERGTGPWFKDWGEVARAMELPTSAEPGEALNSGHPTDASSYWGNLMPAISYAVDHGAPGAAAAWNRIVSASNFSAQLKGYNANPVWSVQPRARK